MQTNRVLRTPRMMSVKDVVADANRRAQFAVSELSAAIDTLLRVAEASVETLNDVGKDEQPVGSVVRLQRRSRDDRE